MLKVLSFNLWHDAGPWPERARRIRAWLDRLDPDRIALQEVLRRPGRDLAAELVGDRGHALAFARASHERQVAALAAFARGAHERGSFPPLLAGDFNAEPDSDEIRYLTGLHSLGGRSEYWNECWRVAGRASDGITWSNRNAYARFAWEPDRRIDDVFAGYALRDGRGHVEDYRVVCDDERAGVWPSDHFGVCALLCTEPMAVPG